MSTNLQDQHAALFAKVGIQPRRKGQRYDKGLFGSLADRINSGGCRGVPANAKVQQLGESTGSHGYSVEPSKCWLFAVTLEDGTVVPAYSFSPEGPNGYMICQDYSFKAKKGGAA